MPGRTFADFPPGTPLCKPVDLYFANQEEKQTFLGYYSEMKVISCPEAS